jgi:hypothetical protein
MKFFEEEWRVLGQEKKDHRYFVGHAERELYNLLVPDMERRAIDIRTFEDLYGAATIEKDTALVKKREKQFSESDRMDQEAPNKRMRGKLCEAILADQIESSNWFGDNAAMIVPSRYDDTENGIDGIVEFDEGTARSHLALAIDITENKQLIAEKLAKIKKHIDEGYPSRIKYFESKFFRGELRHVPQVVVGADSSSIAEVAQLILDFKQHQKNPRFGKREAENQQPAQRSDFKETRERLANHPLQFKVLFEIRFQLEAFTAYAEIIGDHDLADMYRHAQAIIDSILQEKLGHGNSAKLEEELSKDNVYTIIKKESLAFKSSGA